MAARERSPNPETSSRIASDEKYITADGFAGSRPLISLIRATAGAFSGSQASP
jgi:hypothetical protein